MRLNNLKLNLVLIILVIAGLFISGRALAATKPASTPTPAPKKNLLALCLSQQTSLKKIMFNTVTLAQSMLSQIDIINTKVISHYALVTLKNKKQLPNFDQITSSLNTQKNTIDTSLKLSTVKIAELSCTGTNPLESFINAGVELQNSLTALSSYKSSSRNLIVSIIALDEGATAVDTLTSLAPSPTASSSATTPSPSSTTSLNQFLKSQATSSPSPSSSPTPKSTKLPAISNQ